MIPVALYLFVLASEARPLVGSGVAHPYDIVAITERASNADA